jgi:hypothetical protein
MLRSLAEQPVDLDGIQKISNFKYFTKNVNL